MINQCLIKEGYCQSNNQEEKGPQKLKKGKKYKYSAKYIKDIVKGKVKIKK